MAQIPKYSKQLIEHLDAEVPYPELPKTQGGWASLSDGEIRRGAYLSGYRALVDDLMAALEEDNHGAEAPDGTESGMGYGDELYQDMAPARLARGNPEAIIGDVLYRDEVE